jgi:uncharacterized protein YaaW (UPF0174 family)
MAQPKYIERHLHMKSEVIKIFEDLEGYLNYCRYNMLKYDERDLYRSEQYKRFDRDRQLAKS